MDSLFYYDNKRGRIVEKYSFPYLTEDNYIYRYNQGKKMIFATHGGGGGPISYLDLEKKIWENYVEEYESDGLFYTSNFLYDYESHDIYTLGGYGWYEQKNILQKYNEVCTYKSTLSRSGSTQQVPRSTAIKVIDFGGATYDDEKKSCVVNTRQYRAPEVILGTDLSCP